MNYRIKPIVKPAVVTPTPLWETGSPYPIEVPGFHVQVQRTSADVLLGDENITDENDSLYIPKGNTVHIETFQSRGSPGAYDLSQIYYLGGPLKLILEVQAKKPKETP